MTTIISYTYEADDHCIACTVKRYQANGFDTLDEEHPVFGNTHDFNPNYNDLDEHGVAMNAMDYEGNPVHPRFSTDEWQELDEGFLADNPIQYLACGNCHEVIKEYDHNTN